MITQILSKLKATFTPTHQPQVRSLGGSSAAVADSTRLGYVRKYFEKL